MCVCVCCVAAVQGRARVCVGGRCGVGGRGGAGRECVWVGLHVWRVGRDRGRASQPGKGQRSVCVSGVCVCLWGRGGVWCSLWHVGPCESVLRGGGGRVGRCVVYWCHEGACAPHGCVRGGRDRGRETQPGKGQRSVCVSGCVCVCVCVWRAVCVCVGGGMHVVCGQRHRHRITQPGKGQHCVCARACVYVCVHTRMCVAWAGCLCVGGGGA